jgi:hypothetical protein
MNENPYQPIAKTIVDRGRASSRWRFWWRGPFLGFLAWTVICSWFLFALLKGHWVSDILARAAFPVPLLFEFLYSENPVDARPTVPVSGIWMLTGLLVYMAAGALIDRAVFHRTAIQKKAQSRNLLEEWKARTLARLDETEGGGK